MSVLPIEIERKYIIRIPSEEKMHSCDGYTVSEIQQIYIESSPLVTHRVRSRKKYGKTVYTETKKIRIDKMSSYEDEREICESEFNILINKTKQGTSPIIKTRHVFDYFGKTFEVDVYPEWKNTCIMEIELKSKEEEIHFPPFVEILKEVTGNKAFSNASMARSFPSEII